MEMDPREKLVLKIREDMETKPIEVNVQSAGVAEEEQVFFTEQDEETETQIWERKNQSSDNLIDHEGVIQIDSISENIVDFTQKIAFGKSQTLPKNCAERIKFCSNNPKTLYCANLKPKFRTKIILKRFSSRISDTNTTLTNWTE